MSIEKKFGIPKEQIRQLLPVPMGGCYASDRVMVDRMTVNYMYREVSTTGEFWDSGWRFFAGDESQEYADDASHFCIYDVNTVANYDPDIIPCLHAVAPCAFEKIRGTNRYRPVDPPEEVD